MSATESLTYEEACEAHRWRVPERYNIAADVCDSQPRDRPRWSSRTSAATSAR